MRCVKGLCENCFAAYDIRGRLPKSPQFLNLLVAGVVGLSLPLSPAAALTIDDVFDSSITGAGNAAAIESAINAASLQIASLYSDPITVQILFQTSSGVGGAQSNTSIYYGPTNAYLSFLGADAAAHPANTTLGTAVNHLPSVSSDSVVFLSSSNLRALGYSPAPGTITINSNTYDGVITLNPTFATTTAIIQHEIDEVLGGGGVGTVLGQGLPSAINLGSLDIYRYSAPGTLSLTPSTTATAYFSVDGGVTPIAYFNQSGSGDYGDFLTTPCLIQSWAVCGTTDTFTKNSVEFAMLEAIGYDPYPTPLPSSWMMMISGLAGFGLLARRKMKKAHVVAAMA